MTRDITKHLNEFIDTTQDAVISELFGGRSYVVNDYFYATDSLRLRKAGFELLKVCFDHETFSHCRNFRTGELLKLHRNLESPFYIDGRKLVLFSGQDIVMCQMHEDITSWLNNLA